jgi:hypothetical protein
MKSLSPVKSVNVVYSESKMWALGRIGYCLHLIAKASEFPNHFRGACSLRLFAHGWAAFLVAAPSVQDDPDQPTKPIDNGPDGLFVSQTQYEAAIQDLENAAFGFDCSVGTLIENAPHMTVALGTAVTLGYSATLVISRAGAHPGRQVLGRSKRRCLGTDFGNDRLRRIHSQTRYLGQPLHCLLVRAE